MTDATAPTATAARLLLPRLAGFYAWGEGVGYALLRAGFGVVILTHGLPKLLGTPHGSMADPAAGAMRMVESLGLPFAPQLILFVTSLETVGAVRLAAGLLTRLVAPMFAVQMLVICLATRAQFAWFDRGFEFPLMLGLTALYFAMRGGGPFSLNRHFRRE